MIVRGKMEGKSMRLCLRKNASRILISVLAIFLVVVVAEGKSEAMLHMDEGNEYPVNDKGQTYGPDVKESTEEPDLILVESSDGDLGYVKATDLNGADYKTPEDALSYKTEGRWVDVYLSDGETKIGEFYIGK